MQALKLDAENKKLLLCDVPIPEIEHPSQVIVRVEFAGLCGTDLHIMDGSRAAKDGVIVGHELAGHVVAVGSAVTAGVEVGDRVIVDPHQSCGDCFYCAKQQTNFCINLYDCSLGIHMDGSFARFCRVQGKNVHRLHDHIPLEMGVLIEPVSCIVHAMDQVEPLERAHRVLVLGGGVIGLLTAIMLKQDSFNDVTICELNPNRCEVLRGFNVATIITPRQLEVNHEQYHRDPLYGYDRVFDYTGSSAAVATAINYMRKGGKLALFGLPGNPGASFDINMRKVLTRELTITGSLRNPRSLHRAIEAIGRMCRGGVKLESLKMKQFPLHKYEEALTELKLGVITKIFFKLTDFDRYN